MAALAEEIRAESYVGFDSITQQIEHKLLKRGFQFNVIVVGALRLRFLPPPLLDKKTFFLGRMKVPGSNTTVYRTNRVGKVDIDQHHLCVALD